MVYEVGAERVARGREWVSCKIDEVCGLGNTLGKM